MARRRLGPALVASDGGDAAAGADGGAGAPETKSFAPRPPIAQVAGEASGLAAFQTLATEVSSARQDGRLVLDVALDSIAADYLIRDRMAVDAAGMAVLAASLAERGQQMPLDVVDLGGGRFGLISGWRRLTALRHLRQTTGDERFATARVVLRRPETLAAAYRAMVEENEIRADLSFYERARIVARAAGQGIYADPAAALAGLFGTASRTRRSKIGSFVRVHDALDDRLRFAAAIPERLGLVLAKRLEAEPGFGPTLRERLRKGAPEDAAAELALLTRAAAEPAAGAAPAAPLPAAARPEASRILMQGAPGYLELKGRGVTPALREALQGFLDRWREPKRRR